MKKKRIWLNLYSGFWYWYQKDYQTKEQVIQQDVYFGENIEPTVFWKSVLVPDAATKFDWFYVKWEKDTVNYYCNESDPGSLVPIQITPNEYNKLITYQIYQKL